MNFLNMVRLRQACRSR